MEQPETRLSGAVGVRRAGLALTLSPQTLRLIVSLAASRGLPVSTDTLCDRLWEQPPSDRSLALRVAVRRAREQLGDSTLIETVPTGYRYVANPTTVDLWRFETEATRILAGRDEPLETIESCLAIWRGEPFGTLGDLPFLMPLATLLSELHRSLEECRLQALLNVGNVAQAVAAAEELVVAEPLRENRWAFLMLGLYRHGRQAESLRAFQRARSTLLETAGLTPGPQLLRLEQQILDHDPSLAEPTRRPITTLAGGLSKARDRLVGREAPLTLLASVTPGPAYVVVGEPGIGKSALLRTCSQDWPTPFVSVAASDSPQRPSLALVTLIEGLLTIGWHPTDPLAVAALRHVLPSIGHDVSTSRLDSDDPALTREEIIDSVAESISKAMEFHNVRVVVDDCQWLDRLSSDVLAAVSRSCRAVLVLGTRPPREPHLAWIGAVPEARRIDLRHLLPADSSELLQRRGAASWLVSRAEELHNRSGGNPLLLTLLAEAEQGDGQVGTSRSVQDAVALRMQALSSSAVETLRIGSVFGHRFEIAHLAALRPTAQTDLLEAADAGIVDRVVISDSRSVEEVVGYSFVHGLVAESIAGGIAKGRRVEIADDIVRLLVQTDASATVLFPYALLASPLDPWRAAEIGNRAGQLQERSFAFDEAVRCFQQCIAVLDRARTRALPLRASLLIQLGRALRLSARPASRATLIEGIVLAREAGLPELFAAGVVDLCSHGETTSAGRFDPEAAALLDEALALPVGSETAARLCASAATLLSMSSAGARGRELFLRSWTLAEAAGNSDLEAEVLMNAHLGLSHPSDLPRRTLAASRLRELSGDVALRLWESTFLDLGHSLLTAERAGLDTSIAQLRALTPRVKGRPRDFGLAFSEAAYAHATGDLDAADDHIERALAIGRTAFDPTWSITVYSGIKLTIQVDRGDISSLRPGLDRLLVDMPDFEPWHAVKSLMALDAGDQRGAAESLLHALRDRASHVPRDLTWGPVMMCLSRTASGLGDIDSARWLYEELSQNAGLMSWGGSCTYGPIDLALAMLADTLGEHERSKLHYEASNRLATRLGCVSYVV